MSTEVFKNEWEEWRGNKVTKAFLKVLFNKREYLKEMWADNKHGTDKEKDLDMGQCIAIKDTIDYALYEFEFIEKEQKDNAESSGI